MNAVVYREEGCARCWEFVRRLRHFGCEVEERDARRFVQGLDAEGRVRDARELEAEGIAGRHSDFEIVCKGRLPLVELSTPRGLERLSGEGAVERVKEIRRAEEGTR